MSRGNTAGRSGHAASGSKLTFLFYHYGAIPSYLRHAIEHVRVFNPDAEILLLTEAGVPDPAIAAMNVSQLRISDFPSAELKEFQSSYQHISCFKEKFEKFVLERWFITESIRRQAPERIYIMQDSDVAVFGEASQLLSLLPSCPIGLASMNPHFTFIQGAISGFLQYILAFYQDPKRVARSRERQAAERHSAKVFNQGEMQFLFDYLRESKLMQFYETDTPFGFVDCNIHIPQDFDYMQLPRRPRKKVIWGVENGRMLPYFVRHGKTRRALVIHFQGPGKRVFFRFNRMEKSAGKLFTALANIVFQNPHVARFT